MLHLHAMLFLAIGGSNAFSFDLKRFGILVCTVRLIAMHTVVLGDNNSNSSTWAAQSAKQRQLSHHLLWLDHNATLTDSATQTSGILCPLWSLSWEFICKTKLKVMHVPVLRFPSFQSCVFRKVYDRKGEREGERWTVQWRTSDNGGGMEEEKDICDSD